MIDYIDGIVLQTSYTNLNSRSNCFNEFDFASRLRMLHKIILGKKKKRNKKEEKN